MRNSNSTAVKVALILSLSKDEGGSSVVVDTDHGAYSLTLIPWNDTRRARSEDASRE